MGGRLVIVMPHKTFWKESKGARLRTKQQAKEKDAREMAALYRLVYARDKYRCVACGKRVVVGSLNELERAHPHHIVFRSQSKALVKASTNVATVCVICHADVHDRRLFITGNADVRLTITRKG